MLFFMLFAQSSFVIKKAPLPEAAIVIKLCMQNHPLSMVRNTPTVSYFKDRIITIIYDNNYARLAN